MKVYRSLLAIMIITFWWAQLSAEETPTSNLNSVVKLRAFIPSDARTAKSLGTEREGHGVVIDDAGHILTIGYLILEAEAIEVTGPDGQPIVAAFVAYDHATGFGLLKVGRTKNLKPIKFGQSSQLGVGDPIFLLGHEGAGASQSARVIAREKFVGYWEYLLDDAFYVAPAHPQFAGLAMLNMKGQLMGIGSIFTQMVIPQYGAVACNMFVPIDLLKPILADLIQSGRVTTPPKPWLGMHANETRGRVFVDRVHIDAPAQRAGIRKNDIILSVDQIPVTDLAQFYRKVWALGQAGVEVPLTILQGNEVKKVIVRSADRYQYLQIKPTRKAPPAITEKSI